VETIRFGQTRLSFAKNRHPHFPDEEFAAVRGRAHDDQPPSAWKGKNVRVFHLAQGLNLIPPDWQLEGRDSLLVKGTLKEDDIGLCSLNGILDPFAFSEP